MADPARPMRGRTSIRCSISNRRGSGTCARSIGGRLSTRVSTRMRGRTTATTGTPSTGSRGPVGRSRTCAKSCITGASTTPRTPTTRAFIPGPPLRFDTSWSGAAPRWRIRSGSRSGRFPCSEASKSRTSRGLPATSRHSAGFERSHPEGSSDRRRPTKDSSP